MFTTLKNFINKLFTDFQSTFLWIFALGFLFCGLMVWLGGEENAPKFKKGLLFTICGLVVFLLAKPIVQYLDAGL